jgi:hypothetical protein
MHEVKAGTGKESAPIAAVDEAAHVICIDPAEVENGGFPNLKKSILLEDSRSG